MHRYKRLSRGGKGRLFQTNFLFCLRQYLCYFKPDEGFFKPHSTYPVGQGMLLNNIRFGSNL